MTVPDRERRDIMENSENKKTPEELADEALDKVAGGEYGGDFVVLNCRSCRHHNNDCPYGTPLGAVLELKPSYWTLCPSKEA